MTLEQIQALIRTVPDYPLPGILFYDVTTMFKDPEALRSLVDMTYELYKDKGVTKVVGIESRGFVLASALAVRLGAGFVPLRKPGKLPAKVFAEAYDKEYGKDIVEIDCPPVSESWLTDFMKPFDEADVLDTLASQAAVLRIQQMADTSNT